MKIEISVDIRAPRTLVWRLAQDPELRPTWDVRVSRYTVHGEPGEGVPVTIVFRSRLYRGAEARGTLVRFDPPRQSALRLDASQLPAVARAGGTWVFEETAEGTRMTTRFNLKPDDATAIPRWLLRLLVHVDTVRSLRNLRRLVLRTLEEGGCGAEATGP
jgi:uncharacterized protein YndB with AHSA1/START domain